MTLNKRLFVIPCLTPLLVLLIIASFNNTKSTRIRILIWQTPSANIGTHIALGSLTGSLLAFTAIYSLTSNKFSNRRKVHFPYNVVNNDNDSRSVSDNFEQSEPNGYIDGNQQIIERDYRDPSPTVSVPFRILKNIQYSNVNPNIHNPESQQDLYDDGDFAYSHDSEDAHTLENDYREDEFVDNSKDFVDSSYSDHIRNNTNLNMSYESDWSVAISENW